MSTYSSILLEETELGWVATHREREISSAPCDDRETALEDLDENIALADGRLELNPELLADLEATADEEYAALAAGDTISPEELKRQLDRE